MTNDIFSITIVGKTVLISGPTIGLHTIGASLDAAGGFRADLINGILHATPDDGDVDHLVQVLSEYLAVAEWQ